MVHLNPNSKRSLGTGIAFLVIATLAVALRLYTKTLTRAKWAADDWWICLSLVGFFSWTGVQCWGKIWQLFEMRFFNSGANTNSVVGIFSGGGVENIQDLLLDLKTLQIYLKVFLHPNLRI